MRIITIKRSAIDRLKESWPCHNIPDEADLIVVALESNDDLVDYEICDSEDNIIVENEDTGTALVALFSDAQARAVNTTPQSNLLDNWVYA